MCLILNPQFLTLPSELALNMRAEQIYTNQKYYLSLANFTIYWLFYMQSLNVNIIKGKFV